MPVFSINNAEQLNQISEQSFKLEKDIQRVVEKNVQTLFQLELVRSEFSLNNFRIDTLAFDKEIKSFVIIEYKKDKNYSVIDQGYAYLSLMLNNKADFILEYNEHQIGALKKNDVDWSQSRVMFVSPFFTLYQREAINFKDLPIELWEIKRFNNNTIQLDRIQTNNSKESVKSISTTGGTIENVTKEIRVYTEEEHLEKATDEIKELYEQYRQAILGLSDIEIKPRKQYIAFIAKTNVTDIVILNSALRLTLNLKKGELQDPLKLARDMSSTGNWGNGDYEVKVNNDENFDYIVTLIKQSLKKQSEVKQKSRSII